MVASNSTSTIGGIKTAVQLQGVWSCVRTDVHFTPDMCTAAHVICEEF